MFSLRNYAQTLQNAQNLIIDDEDLDDENLSCLTRNLNQLNNLFIKKQYKMYDQADDTWIFYASKNIYFEISKCEYNKRTFFEVNRCQNGKVIIIEHQYQNYNDAKEFVIDQINKI